MHLTQATPIKRFEREPAGPQPWALERELRAGDPAPRVVLVDIELTWTCRLAWFGMSGSAPLLARGRGE